MAWGFFIVDSIRSKNGQCKADLLQVQYQTRQGLGFSIIRRRVGTTNAVNTNNCRPLSDVHIYFRIKKKEEKFKVPLIIRPSQ